MPTRILLDDATRRCHEFLMSSVSSEADTHKGLCRAILTMILGGYHRQLIPRCVLTGLYPVGSGGGGSYTQKDP